MRKLVASVLLAGTFATTGSAAEAQAHDSTVNTVTLTMWNDILGNPGPGVSNANFWPNKAISLFEAANPGIRVKLIRTPGASSNAFAALLKSSEVAGNTPDVGEFFAGGQVLQNANYVLPLNQYITPSFKASLNDGSSLQWQLATAGFKTSGPLYGVPFGIGNYFYVYYNKALFKKAGVNTSSLPTTWPGLISLAKQIKADGIVPFQFGEENGYFGAWAQDALISSEVGTQGVLNMFTGKLSLDSPAIIRAYTAWQQLFADGLTNPDAASTNNTQSWAQFAAGNGAMTITGPFADAALEIGAMKNNIGIFPVPALPGAMYPKVLSGGPQLDYVIFKSTKYPKQAMALIKFLVSPQVQTMSLDQGFGQIPNNASYVAGPALQKLDPVLYQMYQFQRTQHYVLAEAFDNIMPGSICTYWYSTNTGVFSGSLSPSSAAKSLEQQELNYLATSAKS